MLCPVSPPGYANSSLLQSASCFSFSQSFSLFQSFGFSLVARSSYHWQLSFSQAEQVLFEQLDEDGGCRKQCYRVMRQLKEEVWCPGRRPVITTHHLQVSSGRGGGVGATVSRWVPVCDGIRTGLWELCVKFQGVHPACISACGDV